VVAANEKLSEMIRNIEYFRPDRQEMLMGDEHERLGARCECRIGPEVGDFQGRGGQLKVANGAIESGACKSILNLLPFS
jgi:hypothetical protein